VFAAWLEEPKLIERRSVAVGSKYFIVSALHRIKWQRGTQRKSNVGQGDRVDRVGHRCEVKVAATGTSSRRKRQDRRSRGRAMHFGGTSSASPIAFAPVALDSRSSRSSSLRRTMFECGCPLPLSIKRGRPTVLIAPLGQSKGRIFNPQPRDPYRRCSKECGRNCCK